MCRRFAAAILFAVFGLVAHSALAQPFTWPADTPAVTQQYGCKPYGDQRCAGLTSDRYEDGIDVHTGVDLGGTRNTPVYPAADGWIEKIFRTLDTFERCDGSDFTSAPVGQRGLGNAVIVRHANGLFTLYGHLHCLDAGIDPSMQVFAAGENRKRIGRMGNSATIREDDFGVHLHFEIKHNGVLGDTSDSSGIGYVGYTPGHPDLYSYRDPVQIIDGVLIEDITPRAVQNPPPGRLNVRSAPGEAYHGGVATNVNDELHEGQHVIAHRRAFAGGTEWLFVDLASVNQPVETATTPNNGPHGGWIAAAEVSTVAADQAEVTDTLRVRSLPSETAAVLGRVYPEQRFVVHDSAAATADCSLWRRIDLHERASAPSGWICADYLVINGGGTTATATPTSTSPPNQSPTPTRTATRTATATVQSATAASTPSATSTQTRTAGPGTPTSTRTLGSSAVTIESGPTGLPNPVNSGGTVSVSVSASSSADLSLSYDWSFSCPTLPAGGGFNVQGNTSPNWTAPQNGTGAPQSCSLTVTVTDGQGGTASGSYSQMVNAIAPFAVSLAVPSLTFGMLTLGQASELPADIINDTGTVIQAHLEISGPEQHDFRIVGQPQSEWFALSEGRSPLSVQFAPAGCGTRMGLVVFSYTIPNVGASLLTLPVTGSGPPCTTSTPTATRSSTPTLTPTSSECLGNGDFAWSRAGDMPAPGTVGASVVLGTHLFTFGHGGFWKAWWRYDPATDGWAPQPDLPGGCGECGVAALGSRIYVFSDGTDFNGVGTVTQIFDTATSQWTFGAAIPAPRRGPAVGTVNGRIYIIGGLESSAVSIYDPTGDQWTTGADMPTARAYAAAAVLHGKIYVLGGQTADGSVSPFVDAYDPAADSWISFDRTWPGTWMPTRRYGATAGAIGCKIYVAGGRLATGSASNAVEEFDPATPPFGFFWTSKTGLSNARAFLGGGVVDNRLIAAGGSDGLAELASVEQGPFLVLPTASPTTTARPTESQTVTTTPTTTRSATATRTLTPTASVTRTMTRTTTASRTVTRTATAPRTATSTIAVNPQPQLVLDPISGPIIVGAAATFTGSGFTQGSRVIGFVSTANGAQSVGPFTPRSRTATQLVWDVPGAMPLGQGFGIFAVVNTDQGYIGSAYRRAFLYGNASLNQPTILSINGGPLHEPDGALPVVYVATPIYPGSIVTITGSGFNAPALNFFTSTGNLGPLFPLANATSTLLQVQIPIAAPLGLGAFEVINNPYLGTVGSQTVFVPIGDPPTITAVTQSGSTITVAGSGFATGAVVNFFNRKPNGSVANLGGGQLVAAVASATRLTFGVPPPAVPGPSYVQIVNPPFIGFTSTGSDPNGGFVLGPP